MSDNFEGIPQDLPADVPAEIQSDGAVTENFTGEQVADEGGNPAWYDTTYPGQITNQADNPGQDAYGLNILNAQQTAQLTRNINPAFINNLVDPGIPHVQQAAVSRLQNKFAQSPYTEVAVSRSVPGVTSADSPTQDAYSLIILRGDQTRTITGNFNANTRVSNTGISVELPGGSLQFENAAQYATWSKNPQAFAVSNIGGVNTVVPYPQTSTARSPSQVDTGAGAAIAAANEQIAADAARLNDQTRNPYLSNIDQAAIEIGRGQDGIATATQTIQSAQQKIADSESYIAQNNAELADPNISAERRAVLEANNAAQTQNIFDQTQSITENQAYITRTQETIQFNEAAIDANSAGYRATTAGSNVPVVDVNADPNFVGPQQITPITPTTSATPVNAQDGEAFGPALPDGNGGFVDAAGNPVDANGVPIFSVPRATYPPSTVDDPNITTTSTAATAPFFGANPDAEAEAAAAAQVGSQLAQQQAVTAAQKRSVNNGDWRVRLSLAPGARYLYNAPDPGILAPLTATDGIVFPYTPKIDLTYKADYDSYALTHSNYKGYFYKSSYTDQVQLHATFTAQDTAEANYLLAVMHFFRSVTKMFYGQDPQRGAPPPLVYLTGLGQYQFAEHPCLVTSFSYQLPDNVDYIRARSTNINGTNMLTRRVRQDLPTNPISGAVNRLNNLLNGQGISYGAEICRPPPPTLGQNQPTYVPTKIEFNINLLPVQSRKQVSQQFSLRDYANGDLLKRGFW